MTVILTDEEAERIETAARDRGISTDELLHEAVVANIAPTERFAPDDDSWSRIIGIGASGRTDISSRFDEVLAETFTRFLLEEEVSYPETPSLKDETEGSLSADQDQIGKTA